MKVILFDLNETLIDSRQMRSCYARQLGIVMSERFGGVPQAWTEADHRIVEDWDSYYADLDLNGEHGLEDLREGEVRTTRALFRLTGTPEPDREALLTLARDLPYLALRHCDVFYNDCKPVLQQLHTAGYRLGIVSHTTTAQIRGTLEGGGVQHWFTGPILGPDITGHFTKDREFFLTADVNPAGCLVVDDQEEGLQGAKAAGMRAIQLIRDAKPPSPHADHVLRGSLDGLLDILNLTA